MSHGRIWKVSLPLVPPDKGNSHKIGWRAGKKPCIVSASDAVAFRNAACMFLRTATPPNPPIAPNERLCLGVLCRFPDYRKDGSIEMVADALQMAGIVPNDRQFRVKNLTMLDSIGEPMTEIVIWRDGQLPWVPQPRTEAEKAALRRKAQAKRLADKIKRDLAAAGFGE